MGEQGRKAESASVYNYGSKECAAYFGMKISWAYLQL